MLGLVLRGISLFVLIAQGLLLHRLSPTCNAADTQVGVLCTGMQQHEKAVFQREQEALQERRHARQAVAAAQAEVRTVWVTDYAKRAVVQCESTMQRPFQQSLSLEGHPCVPRMQELCYMGYQPIFIPCVMSFPCTSCRC